MSFKYAKGPFHENFEKFKKVDPLGKIKTAGEEVWNQSYDKTMIGNSPFQNALSNIFQNQFWLVLIGPNERF